MPRKTVEKLRIEVGYIRAEISNLKRHMAPWENRLARAKEQLREAVKKSKVEMPSDAGEQSSARRLFLALNYLRNKGGIYFNDKVQKGRSIKSFSGQPVPLLRKLADEVKVLPKENERAYYHGPRERYIFFAQKGEK